jgi:hypothetical protein
MSKSWLHDPFDRLRMYLEETTRLVALSRHGVGMVSSNVGLIEALHGLDRAVEGQVVNEEAASEVAAARAESELAQDELKRDFPLLHAHSLVGVWGAAESWASDVATSWLTRFPEDYAGPERARVDTRLLLDDDRSALLSTLVDFAATSKRAPTRVDALLDVAGLRPSNEAFTSVEVLREAGSVDGLRRDVVELSQVRHCIAHNAGVVDERLLRHCSWYSGKVGDPIRVGHVRFREYVSALTWYAVGTFQHARLICRDRGVELRDGNAAS